MERALYKKLKHIWLVSSSRVAKVLQLDVIAKMRRQIGVQNELSMLGKSIKEDRQSICRWMDRQKEEEHSNFCRGSNWLRRA